MKFRRIFLSLVTVFALSVSPSARADFWGADIPILMQILAQAIQQGRLRFETIRIDFEDCD